MGQANYELALYEGILHAITNPALLLSPLTTKEAVLSSKIEGTQATLEEVLDYQAFPRKGVNNVEDIREVLNYRESLRYAVEYIKNRPINLNLCKEMQYILLDGVRGKDKARGEFRTTQNWIGSRNCKIEEANYVPPPPNVLRNTALTLNNTFMMMKMIS
jgi:Fic family protein